MTSTLSLIRSPGMVLTLSVREGLYRQPIPWKEDMMDVPVSDAPAEIMIKGSGPSPKEALPYGRWS